jgi:mRNA interferase HigB
VPRGRPDCLACETQKAFVLGKEPAQSGCHRQQPGCADARGPLESWHEEALKAIWKSPQDVKGQYASASICGNNRVVFNVGGNKYRLVVEMQYRAGIVWVKFIGTHEQYNRINVESVNDHQAHSHR